MFFCFVLSSLVFSGVEMAIEIKDPEGYFVYISLVQKNVFLDLRSDLRICFSVGQN